MTDLNELESPEPLRFLYKYLSDERIDDVLANKDVRISKLVNTNDSFEVRRTVEKMLGPEAISIFDQEKQSLLNRNNLKAIVAEQLDELGMGQLDPEYVLSVLEKGSHGKLLSNLGSAVDRVLNTRIVPNLNSSDAINEMYNHIGNKVYCFSLSEKMDISPMWAHYANNNKGFVIAFDTGHEWFQYFGSKENKSRLHKVNYFDGKIVEPLQNANLALMSKLSDWDYEKEWRLCFSETDIEKCLGPEHDPIQLVSLPTKAIARVIIGSKMSATHKSRIKEIVENGYPHAKLFQAMPNSNSHTYDELSVD